MLFRDGRQLSAHFAGQLADNDQRMLLPQRGLQPRMGFNQAR